MTDKEFFEELTMMKLEESYPTEIKRLDELSDKEKTNTLTSKEKWDLDVLDKKLLSEHRRCKLHYQINWNFMTQDVKKKYRDQVEKWQSTLTSETRSKEIR